MHDPADCDGRPQIAHAPISGLFDRFKYNADQKSAATQDTTTLRPRRQLCKSPMSSKSSTLVKARKRKSRSYADPAVYALLPQSVPDCIREGLTLLIVGLNPGVLTAKTGLHFANPTNLFWPLLYESNIITRPMKSQEGCACLVDEFDIGITNIIERPTAESSELAKSEYKEAAIKLEEKVRRYRPKAISCSGKGIWEAIFRQIHGRPLRKQDSFEFGWQKEEWACCADGYKCPVFVTMGTSGRVAAYSPAYKRQVFADLGRWVNSVRPPMDHCNSNRERFSVLDVRDS